MDISLYTLKPRFQALLRPVVAWLAARHITANAVTVMAAAGSVAIAGIVAYNVFVTRVDNFNYMMDEASYEAVQLLSAAATERK